MDDLGREIRVQTFDDVTGRLEFVDETEYDKDGNVEKTTRTVSYEDGKYNIIVWDGEWAILSDITYYPDGNVYDTTEHNPDGSRKKWTWYYKSGKTGTIAEFNDQGIIVTETTYYENGQIQSVREYNDQGECIEEVFYEEDGTVSSST